MESVPLASPSSSAMSSSPRQRPLLRSFAVFSPSLSCDREELAEDNILFYYPFTDHVNRQLNQVGFCIATASVCARFSGVTSEPRRRGATTARTREHEIQCRDRVISLTNPYADLWLALELSSPLSVDRSTLQVVMNRCFDLFALLYGRDAVEGLLIPPSTSHSEAQAAAAQSRAALHAHCTAFVAYLQARLAAIATGAVIPHMTLVSPVLDITTPTAEGSRPKGRHVQSAAAALDQLMVVSETAKERLHFIVKASLRRFREAMAPETLDYDVPRASRHTQGGWETLPERQRPAPPVRSPPPASATAAPHRRAEAMVRVLWAVLCASEPSAAAPYSPPDATGDDGRRRQPARTHTYTAATASEFFPRRLLALLTTYLEVYGVPSEGDLVPCYLLASAATRTAGSGPSHWLLASQTGDAVVLCVLPAAAVRATPTYAAEAVLKHWTTWLTHTAQRAGEYVRADARSLAAGGAVDDGRLLLHGVDVSQSELRRCGRLSGLQRRPSLLFSPGLSSTHNGTPLGCWLMHGQAVIHGPSPSAVPPMVWRATLRLLGYVRDRKATSSAARAPPERLWLPCGPYWLALAVAATDPDGTNGDVLVTVFHAAQRLDQCFGTAHELSTSALF